ncbi:tripartite tricarboxylate transporter substrate binding protein [Alcaligenaceae bacterium]|nr:tripartite tricarboxylate transporter substrate binding protein [Alcaligenaceae bacterium]
MKGISSRLFVITIGFLFACAARAAYPDRPVTLVVPFAAGSATDSVGRIVADGLSKRLGQSVIVESKPGATGRIGTEYVTKAKPDGYTLLMATSGTLAVNPALHNDIRYDSVKDFSPVLLVGEVPFALVVNNEQPATSVKELIDHAKSRPKELFFAYASPTAQVSSEIFIRDADFNAVGVSYKSSPNAALGLIGNETQFYFIDFGTGLSHIENGRIRALAVAGNPTNLLPGVPAISETVPGFSITSWNGILAPSGTPEAIVAKLNEELRAVLVDPEIRERLGNMGFEVLGTGTPDDFAVLIRDDLEKWDSWIKEVNISAR